MSDDKVEKLIKRVERLEQKVEKTITDQNRVNQKDYDHITSLGSKLEKTIMNQNKVNQKAYDHVTAMERRFQKMDQRTQKMEKSAPGDPRQQKRELMSVVDNALKEYDRKKGKKGR